MIKSGNEKQISGFKIEFSKLKFIKFEFETELLTRFPKLKKTYLLI